MLRLACAVTLVALVSARLSYEGFKVLEVYPMSREHVDRLRAMPFAGVDDELRQLLDWQPECTRPASPCTLMASPRIIDSVVATLNDIGVAFDVVVENQQRVVDEEFARIERFRAKHRDGDSRFQDWDDEYHRYEDVVVWMEQIAATHSQFASLIALGNSFQGRPMSALRLGLNASAPVFFFNANIHAREWLSPATVQYIINRLVEGVDNNDAEVVTMLQQLEFQIAPMFNVDGNVYTWDVDRNWRKTRTPNAGTTCIGKDPNRNAAAGFGGPGSSNDPCSNSYRGPAPFSEPEVANIANYVAANARIVGYIDIHTAAQNLLEPWGYTDVLPPDFGDINPVSARVSAAIQAVNGLFFPWGPAYTTIYPASGIISDWTYDVAGVKYSWSWELRGPGFNPSPTLIVVSGAEIYEGIKVAAQHLIDEYGS